MPAEIEAVAVLNAPFSSRPDMSRSYLVKTLKRLAWKKNCVSKELWKISSATDKTGRRKRKMMGWGVQWRNRSRAGSGGGYTEEDVWVRRTCLNRKLILAGDYAAEKFWRRTSLSPPQIQPEDTVFIRAHPLPFVPILNQSGDPCSCLFCVKSVNCVPLAKVFQLQCFPSSSLRFTLFFSQVKRFRFDWVKIARYRRRHMASYRKRTNSDHKHSPSFVNSLERVARSIDGECLLKLNR